MSSFLLFYRILVSKSSLTKTVSSLINFVKTITLLNFCYIKENSKKGHGVLNFISMY